MEDYLFTSESVSEGHPDKVADQISDAILDAFLEKDPKSRVACENLVAPSLVVVAGEVNTECYVDINEKVKEVLKSIGYDRPYKGMDYKSCSVLTTINHQSPDIEKKIGFGKNQGAGDQGIMFGYAVDETSEYMPLSISLAHQLVKELTNIRKKNGNNIWPDSKSQVTVKYVNGKVDSVSTIVVSSQHHPDFKLTDLRELIIEELIKKVVPKKYLKSTEYIVNPGGKFTIGGPQADSGLTGRKIIVDSYGGHGSHGGGAFSGKDPSKVDRSGAYMARHIAKNIVASGLARKCLVQLSYAIGRSEPVNIYIKHYGTSQKTSEELSRIVQEHWDLTPYGMIQSLNLLKPRYRKTSTYGHFGRNEEEFTWEKLDKKLSLK